jgi:uncharacterized membrane protein YphA (DoxX/SURF4 family)
LLLLRGVLGLAILAEGRYYLGVPDSGPAAWLVGLWALVGGALLLIGLFTPVAASFVAAGFAGVGLSLLPACSPNLFDSAIAFVFGMTMLVTVAGLGPGAFSVDARLFGRREIIIPPPAF